MQDQAFKFYFIRNGQHSSVFRYDGRVTDDGLVLGEESLSYAEVVDTTSRDNRIVIVLRKEAQLGDGPIKENVDENVFVLESYGITASDLEKRIDVVSSKAVAQRSRAQLLQAGKGDLFRAVTCPYCQATVELSELERTPYVYCRFCESLFKDGGTLVSNGDTYRICDECGLYGRIRGYTEMYLWCILIAWGFNSKRRHMCDAYARSVFAKVLLWSLIPVCPLGFPAALWQLGKAFLGGGHDYPELAAGNGPAKKGSFAVADGHYDRILERQPDHPGVLLNQGMGHLLGRDGEGGVAHLKRAMKACANYLPVLRVVQKLSQGGGGKG